MQQETIWEKIGFQNSSKESMLKRQATQQMVEAKDKLIDAVKETNKLAQKKVFQSKYNVELDRVKEHLLAKIQETELELQR